MHPYKHWALASADATRTVLLVMAAVMATAAVVALLGLRRGVQKEQGEELTTEQRP